VTEPEDVIEPEVRPNLSIPRGFRDILPAEARLRERITRQVHSCFDLWGYEPVETPTLELYDILRQASDADDASFKLFDTDGDLLCLRSDVTLPLARLVAMRLSPVEEAIRLRYRQHVFREEAALRGQMRSFTQLGVEFIGTTGVAADTELLLLLAESLEAAGLDDFTIAFCDVSILKMLLKSCLQKCGGSENWSRQVLDACHRSDFVAVDELASAPWIDPQWSQAIRRFVRMDGGSELIDQVRELLTPLVGQDSLTMLEALQKTACLVEKLGPGAPAAAYKVDFSVMSAFSYYTGLVFAAYAPGIGTPLARGGRYDEMLAGFGTPAPAAGFALNLERIVAQVMEFSGEARYDVNNGIDNGDKTNLTVDSPDDGSLGKVFRQAQELRRSGRTVVIEGGKK
jgi:ATP phosphoribosyltransferase regulatory subunit